MRLRRFVATLAVTAAAVGLTATCSGGAPKYSPPEVGVGDAEIGRRLIEDYGCGACHIIPGVDQADGLVGPSLEHIGDRPFIVGAVVNTPQNMVQFLQDPQAIAPDTPMPDLGITESEARNITAYLASLD